MKPKSSRSKMPAEQVVKDIRHKTRRHFSAEDKIRIVLDGLLGDDSFAELCRREGITTLGPKISWRPASATRLAIRPVLRPVTRSRICGA